MSVDEAGYKLSKLYYSIGEVSRMFNVNASLIRFWEKEFAIIKPKKNKKGNRLFTQKDIKNFRSIYQLVKVEGYTLEGAKQKLKLGVEIRSGSTNEEAIVLLQNLRSKLLDIKEGL